MKGIACACTLACTLTVLVMGKIVKVHISEML